MGNKYFNFNKIKDFDKHINTSIPHYTWLQSQVITMSQYFIQENSNVYDIGCSTGKLLKRMARSGNINYIGIDNSTLLPKTNSSITFINKDICEVKMDNASFITSLFTLQFLPRAKRKLCIVNISNALNKYGAFIICEKTYCSNPIMQDIVNSMYYEFKEKHFSSQDILKKERELRYSLNLLTTQDIIDELSKIGKVDVFWRCFNFIGCVVVKI